MNKKDSPRPGSQPDAGEKIQPLHASSAASVVQAQIEQFGACVFEPTDLVELRLLAHDDRKPAGRFVTAAELPKQGPWLRNRNHADYSCYVGVNPRRRRGRDAKSVSMARCLVVDLDGVALDEVRFVLRDSELPAPTMIVATGGGVHVYWRLDEPLRDMSLWTRYQRSLIAKLGGDKSIIDAPRIMRLPGLRNAKPERKGAMCCIVEANPQRTYGLDEFEDILLPDDSQAARPAMDPTTRNGRFQSVDDVEAYLRERGVEVKGRRHCDGATMILLNRCPINADIVSTGQSEIAVMVGDDGKLSYCNKHNRGANYTWHDLRRAIDPAYRPRWKPFPFDVLPEPLGRFVNETAAAIGCDPAMVAMPILAAMAGAVGNARVIQLKQGWTEPAILWAATVAESGTLKSPSFDAALKPLREAQTEMFVEHAAAMEDYERALAEYEAWKKSKAACKGAPPEKPKMPSCRRILTADATVEALASVLAQNPKGVLLGRDELGGWLAGFNQYKQGRGSDVQTWLEAHRAGPWLIDRKTGTRVTHIPRAAVSIAGTIQPATLQRALAPEFFECGLAARLLLCQPPERVKKWTEATVSEQTERAYGAILRELLRLDLDTDSQGTKVPRAICLSPEAHLAWVAWYERFARRQAEASGHLRAALSKLEGAAARFALLFHLAGWASTPDVPEGPIEPWAIQAGTSLAEWFADETERIYGRWGYRGGGDDKPERAELVTIIRKRFNGQVTARDLARHVNRFKAAGAAKNALDDLVGCGLAVWAHPKPAAKDGRPPTVCRLVECIDETPSSTDDTPRNDTKNGGSVGVGASMSPESACPPGWTPEAWQRACGADSG